MKKFFISLFLIFCFIGSTAFANSQYEADIIERYNLSDIAVGFMRAHNVDFSLFEGAELQPSGYPFSYSSQIEGIIPECNAYNFSDEQISQRISGIIKSKVTIIGGPYDNTGRKTVTLFNYPLLINNTSIDCENSQYPVISYNDTAYFPMTWHYCRMLGINCDWDEEKGFFLEKGEPSQQYIKYDDADNTAKYLYAVLPKYDIYLNGRKTDSQNAEYPFLNFRNVTYFPLTWDYITNELGLEYSFDMKNGLSISFVR